MKINKLIAAALFFLSINVHAVYILIHEKSEAGIPLKNGVTKRVLKFKIGQYDNAIKFADINGISERNRKPPFRLGFDEEMDIVLPLELSTKLLSLLEQPAVEALKYSPSPDILNPDTGKKYHIPPETVPCANIFNFIAFGVIDLDGRGFIVQSSEQVNLEAAYEHDHLKTGNVVLFRNVNTGLVGNVMLYIGNGVLMGWDGEYFFFQSIEQATDYWAQIFPNTTEISGNVIPSSDITKLFKKQTPDNSSTPLIMKYDSSIKPLDPNNLPSYIK